MADTLKLELVSPERLLVSEQVEMVLVPGTEGVFGVLPLHAPTLSTLKPGFVDIYKGNVVVERYFVAGGFAEVSPAGCTILVDEALPQETLTQALATERQTMAKALYDAAATDEDRKQALKALEIADAMLSAAHGALH